VPSTRSALLNCCTAFATLVPLNSTILDQYMEFNGTTVAKAVLIVLHCMECLDCLGTGVSIHSMHRFRGFFCTRAFIHCCPYATLRTVFGASPAIVPLHLCIEIPCTDFSAFHALVHLHTGVPTHPLHRFRCFPCTKAPILVSPYTPCTIVAAFHAL